MKARKKPVEVEFFIWNGGLNKEDEPIWFEEEVEKGVVRFPGLPGPMLIDTLEGTMQAQVGDYIVKGVNGELYPVKPDIFEKTYQVISPQEKDKKYTVRLFSVYAEWPEVLAKNEEDAIRKCHLPWWVDSNDPLTWTAELEEDEDED